MRAVQPSGFVDRPDYRVDILRRRNCVTVRFDDTLLAESTACLLVDEQDHGLVFYFPRHDVRLDELTPTDRTSVCPFKGTASYWRLAGRGPDSIAWSYETPHPEVARLAGHVAFYQDDVHLEVGTAPYNGPRS
ncbi:MAG: DUF427 domain-containing protein [Acidimicrobiia bacterium]|nr:DUF427 domain-containing protein [Acidimicrobiia bacterium]